MPSIEPQKRSLEQFRKTVLEPFDALDSRMVNATSQWVLTQVSFLRRLLYQIVDDALQTPASLHHRYELLFVLIRRVASLGFLSVLRVVSARRLGGRLEPVGQPALPQQRRNVPFGHVPRAVVPERHVPGPGQRGHEPFGDVIVRRQIAVDRFHVGFFVQFRLEVPGLDKEPDVVQRHHAVVVEHFVRHVGQEQLNLLRVVRRPELFQILVQNVPQVRLKLVPEIRLRDLLPFYQSGLCQVFYFLENLTKTHRVAMSGTLLQFEMPEELS